MNALRRLYASLPPPVRRLAAPAKSAYAYLREARCGVWVLRGTGRGGGPLVAAFAGTETTKNDLAGRLFAAPVQESALGRAWQWSARDRALRAAPDAALLVWEVLPRHEASFQPGSFAVLPGWIRMSIDLERLLAEPPSGKLKAARNLVRRAGLAAAPTRDPDRFVRFYRDVHLPFIAARHGSAAILDAVDVARTRFVTEGHELLEIGTGAGTVGGAVVSYSRGEAHFWQIGIRRDLPGRLGRDLGDAIYLLVIERARERGLTRLDLGHSRPFLTDGVLEYKRMWGARLEPERMPTLLALSVLRESPALKDFLLENPFVSVDREGRYHVCAFREDADSPAAAAAAERLKDGYCSPGKVGVRLYALSPRIALTREIRS